MICALEDMISVRILKWVGILRNGLSIAFVKFERIVASKSERASKKRDARGMALPSFARRAIEPPPPAVGKGLRINWLRKLVLESSICYENLGKTVHTGH